MAKNRAQRKRGEPDPLSVQVSFRVKVRKGVQVSKFALNQAYLQWVETGNLPPNIEIRGIFWRNPARKGSLADWRYSAGSDISALKTHGAGVESSARGDHEDARSTLGRALSGLTPF